MASVIIVGTQWGDEGKGKIVDYLAENCEYVVRSQGGSNAGHTVVVDNIKYKLRLLPSGILHKDKVCVIGNGVVIEPKVFLSEIDSLIEKKVNISNLKISDRAHVLMPYHKILDELQEEDLGENKLGTTKNGIGPCYMDKSSRLGIRIVDLMNKETFAKKLKFNVELKNKLLKKLYNHDGVNYDELLKEYLGYAEKLRPFVADTTTILNKAIKEKKNILFEGAQATMLDLDHGTYPFVTSSYPAAGGACTGSGVGPRKIDNVIGVVKAYATRVGEGPFPSELFDDVGQFIRDKGGEYGTVTGRARRCGWLDACVVKYASYVNGLDSIAITRLDILDELDKLKICVAYKYNSEILEGYPADLDILSKVEPVYEEFEGWKTSTRDIREYDKLPENAKKYLKRLSEVIETDISIVSVGAGRDETIIVKKIF
ncbi:adenylosuccinate synthase [Brachyspira hyodysenteriae]|uniref:Adenylosuccinate synthetase n=1 Tax=Brachyspira hyodysenteriae (strain ATCC 49526 / WA1) TaxID=565034 RepID=PURA_BRAHW|nr:adenylosuccinate synthase [Brachyspira hyodysenteriae]C0R2E2.1 RecName: Full=Adenylosuccinate synthetase; Short=AMPSase; Short=AdSS; AltName: Full=IMP--aspartate ligase [Brachyspira hyodysenteriae WA1]ACN84280.1 adenylosuccinate synthase [Brachyspira hyodysenteriae WA1]AUJ50006.1 adenylosuccinate synthetase [Brachyspira hyodysenteriae]KLI43227.1 adenylosuccinate synthetase [Brachyspira hyodysenteriae]KLI48942.1 adenylosuccinate synthetase [Brachyspira hyodysenteriae]KLI49831.1 adenylosucci